MHTYASVHMHNLLTAVRPEIQALLTCPPLLFFLFLYVAAAIAVAQQASRTATRKILNGGCRRGTDDVTIFTAHTFVIWISPAFCAVFTRFILQIFLLPLYFGFLHPCILHHTSTICFTDDNIVIDICWTNNTTFPLVGIFRLYGGSRKISKICFFFKSRIHSQRIV